VNIGDMLLQNVSLFSLSWALQPFASLPQWTPIGLTIRHSREAIVYLPILQLL
jgi:hypothetical protein